MSILSLFKKTPKRLANITVYYINEIIDGTAYASPLGTIPRFSDEYEKQLNAKHKPKPEFGNCAYISEEINNCSVILFWQNGLIEAINFISEKEARSFHEFTPFPKEDLAMLDKALKHFPRSADLK